MNKPTYRNMDGCIITIPQAMEKTNLGRSTVTKIATENKCILRFGKSVRIDWERFKKALELYRS